MEIVIVRKPSGIFAFPSWFILQDPWFGATVEPEIKTVADLIPSFQSIICAQQHQSVATPLLLTE